MNQIMIVRKDLARAAWLCLVNSQGLILMCSLLIPAVTNTPTFVFPEKVCLVLNNNINA